MDGARPGARGLISGTIVLFWARLASAGLALVQVILLANLFGASATTDAFFVASSVCLFFIGPIETALNVAFVPVFVHEVETRGEEAAWRIAAGLFRAGAVGAFGVALLLAVVAPWLAVLLAPGFVGSTSALVAQIIQVMAPIVLFVHAGSFLSNLEFIEGRYMLPAWGMILHAGAGPIALVLFADRLGVFSLAWGVLVGAVLRCLLLSIRVSNVRRLMGPGLRLRDPLLRNVGSMMISRLLTSWFIELNLIVDRVFASWLGPGFVSALAYASRAVMTLVRIFMMPMGRMLLPPLSRLAAREQYDRIREVLEKLVIGIAFLLVPLVAFVAAFRVELLGIVFQHGAFDEGAVDATAEALLFYALGIIPFLVTPLLSATFFALKDSATPFKIGAVCVVANAALDAVLVLGMQHGGIALATSLVGLIRASLLWSYLSRRIGALRSRPVLASLLVSAVTAGLAFWSARVLVSLVGLAGSGTLRELVPCAVIGGVCYLLLQGLFNRPVLRLIPAVLGRLPAGRS